MTFYQELQLSSVASKQLIKATEDKKERRIATFLFIILRSIL